jgi:hypothetical protein
MRREDNYDVFLGINRTFGGGDFSVDAMVGGNKMRRY